MSGAGPRDPRAGGGAEAVSPDPDTPLERALERLDEISQRLESAELELTEALALYEEGVRLVRLADGALSAAEHRIQRLRADGAGTRLDPLEEEP